MNRFPRGSRSAVRWSAGYIALLDSITHRLRALGLDPMRIPRDGGIGVRGYWTYDLPFRVGVGVEKKTVQVTFTPWRVPKSTALGLFAAVRALDRLGGR